MTTTTNVQTVISTFFERQVGMSTTVTYVPTTITSVTMTTVTISPLSDFVLTFGPTSCLPSPTLHDVFDATTFSSTWGPGAVGLCAAFCDPSMGCKCFLIFQTSSTYTCTALAPLLALVLIIDILPVAIPLRPIRWDARIRMFKCGRQLPRP